MSRPHPAHPSPPLPFGGFGGMPGLVHSPWGPAGGPPTTASSLGQSPNQRSPSPRPPGGPLRSDDIQHTPNTHRQGQKEDLTYPRVPCRTASQHRVLGSQVPHLVLAQPRPHCPLRAHCPHDTHTPTRTQFLTPGPQTGTPSPSDHPKSQPNHNSVMTAKARSWRPWSQCWAQAISATCTRPWAGPFPWPGLPRTLPVACVSDLIPWDPRKEAGSAYVTACTASPPEGSANCTNGCCWLPQRQGLWLGADTPWSPHLTGWATFLSLQGERDL